MKTIAAVLFGAGMLLAVRVMFFGVRRITGPDSHRTRAWPLAIASGLGVAGVVLYIQAWRGGEMTTFAWAVVVILSMVASVGARITVQRSEAAAALTTDPDEDPRYKHQGHVARVVSKIGGGSAGRISFVIDGQALELSAKWLPGTTASDKDGAVDSEVVIEHVEGDLAFVEPWALVEGRL